VALKSLAAVVGIGGVLCGAVAWACADGGYETSWDAEASSGFLSPTNDTRSNFILLMADRYGTKVADPAQMAKGIVPFEFPYKVMVARLEPPAAPNTDYSATYREEQDAYGLSPDSSSYFGYDSGNLGLCHTNRSGAQQFAAELKANPRVPGQEKAALAAARAVLAKACDRAGQTQFALAEVKSLEGRAYAEYLEGTRLFYAEDLGAASSRFDAVAASSGWLAETAAYMRFRTAMAQAMKGSVGKWGEIADVEKRDRSAIDHADAIRRQYLRAYPTGRYAASARSFERRIAWLRGDQATLGAQYSTLLARAAAAGGEPDIATMQEIDRRILPSSDLAGVTDPTLLAVADLMRLRPDAQQYPELRSCCGTELSREELERQRPYFKSEPELFGYLLAAEAFFHRQQPREVISLIPDAAHQERFSYVQFSRQMLRGFALEAAGDRNARGFWLSLLGGAAQPYQRATVELAIFKHDQKAGAVGRLLETGSPILHPLIRQKIIEDDAGPDLLRAQARTGTTPQQREVALYLLLANELHHGWYREFLADQRMVGTRAQPKPGDIYGYGAWSVADYEPSYREGLSGPPLHVFANGGSNDLRACPDILSTATSLSANPAAIRPRLCLAEFIRRKGFDGWSDQYDIKLERNVARSRNGFPGKPIERMAIYQGVIASPLASADDKAFAFNRAIRCYQPAGYNSCGGQEVEKPVRKAWFDRLRKEYPGTVWAKELKYYW